jgi:hypothetical protein
MTTSHNNTTIKKNILETVTMFYLMIFDFPFFSVENSSSIGENDYEELY